jgi:hypothetical protein
MPETASWKENLRDFFAFERYQVVARHILSQLHQKNKGAKKIR